MRRTRIVATLGPATDRPGVLERLLAGGLDVARLNFSHGSADDHRRRVQQLRQLAAAAGRSVAVLADLPGPKLRALLAAPLPLEAGQTLKLARRPGGDAQVHLTEPEALARATVGQRVLLDDGRLQGRIAAVHADRVEVEIVVGGVLQPNKGINLPDTDLDIPAVTERDRAAIATALELGADWLALSFVRNAAAADELRRLLHERGAMLPIMAKIERPEAVSRSAEIIEAFDGIMVARGDLGVEIPLEKVPHVQKALIRQARAAGRPVITATDMLDSMRQNPRPTRAEASDVANAVYDGSDAVMLSGETAAGTYPVESLTCMDRIVCEAEQQFLSEERLLPVPRGSLMDHLTHMLCDLAGDIGADAIITPTITGRTARLVARHRPRFDIVAVATSDAVVRQLSVVWGVEAVPFPFPVEPGADRLAAAARAAYLGKAVPQGALALILAAHPVEGGAGVPTIRVVRIGADGEPREP